jgi:tetratricopeptide (TPR) repeat protein
MWWCIGWALAQTATDAAEVAEGWYLWSTGQDDAAYEAADALEAAGVPPGAAQAYVAAMAVDRGAGASLEADRRHRWARSPDDPWRRIDLAWAMSLRHAEEGPWCDEVEVLLGKVTDDEPAYWAALVDRQRSLRCDGTTEHAEAQLRRLARDGVGGELDATLGTLRAKYYKEGFHKEVEAMWAAEPHRLRDAGFAWQDGVAGPSKMAVRKVTMQALEEAASSDDPSLVHAAMLGYRGAGKEKPAEEAEARLAQLDPGADADLIRSIDDVVDPALYRTIDQCVAEARVVEEALACLGRLDAPESGSLAAHYHAALRDVYDVGKDVDAAYAAARAAFEADPSHRFHARVFADRALERVEDLELARSAAEVVLEGWVPDEPAEADESTRRTAGAHLLRLARLEGALEQTEQALEHLELAVSLSDDPELPYWYGMALAAAQRTDEAVVTLAYALAEEVDDLRLVGEARRVLDEALGDWHPGGMKGALAEVKRPLDEEGPTHPLVGQALPEGSLELPEAEEGSEVQADVVLVVASWRPGAERAAERVVAIGERYAERGVRVHLLDVGQTPVTLDEGIELSTLSGDASTLRSLRLLAVPSVVVVDGRGTVRDLIVGYDSGDIAVEDALDAFLPPEADE